MPEASIRRISFERLTLGVLIAGLMWVGGGLLFGAGSLVHLLERSPSRGRTSAFHRGAVIAVDRFRPFERIYHAPNTIRTGHAEGRWLTEEVFGFWPREEYSGRAFPFAWAGLAALQDGELVITVRLVYGVVLQRVGIVLMLLALPITLIATDAGVIGGLIAIAVSAFGLRLNWNGLQRERRSAREAVKEFATRLQQLEARQ